MLLFMLAAQASASEEIVITLGGDCVLGTREAWKEEPDTFDAFIAQ